MKYLEYMSSTLPNISEKFWIIIEFKTFNDPARPYVTLYRLKNGELLKTKVKTNTVFIENPFRLYSILKVENFDSKFKTEKVGDKWVKTDKLELLLNNYEVVCL